MGHKGLLFYNMDSPRVLLPTSLTGKYLPLQVVIALRARGGEHAVLQALGRARELYESGVRSNAATDELSALFAECALAESHSQESAVVAPLDSMAIEAGLDIHGGHGHPILAESGRLQVVEDASADGSSFICPQCGGLVSNLRRVQHLRFWCSSRR